MSLTLFTTTKTYTIVIYVHAQVLLFEIFPLHAMGIYSKKSPPPILIVTLASTNAVQTPYNY